ncbi:hypothetical protein C7S15_7290 [Burkholderia cepacia]|nr:hypothetical protein [Burkholderia cepacia]
MAHVTLVTRITRITRAMRDNAGRRHDGPPSATHDPPSA